jgi:spoIIIJ-associated protein
MTKTDIETDVSELVKKLLTMLGVKYEEIIKKDVAGQVLYCIVTDEKNSGVVIGGRGEVLYSLNYIVNKILFPVLKEKITVDVNDYTKSKIDTVVDNAKIYANRAKDLRYDVELQPANSYERLLVHTALADDPELKTSSTGDGCERRVVIKYIGTA